MENESIPTRTNIAGASPYEPVIGFSRAVRLGRVVHVSGTAPVGAEDLAPAEQTRHVLSTIEAALHQAGATLADVVRTRIYLARADDWESIGRAHGEFFANIRPASTMIAVQLLNPKWAVEIEAEAIVPAGRALPEPDKALPQPQ
jgi:enamine deaminase RidA (YjgF/YER057c/UK114 family)